MRVVTEVHTMQSIADHMRTEGKRIAVVPTMGALHEGHLSLIRCAKQNADTVITTLFVNPTQFAPHEDFQQYPRNRERDIELIHKGNGDIVFVPEIEDMYTEQFATFVVPEKKGELLEGKFRPTHFRGVATVVAKLFNITKPHIAVFGQKDAQQVFILKQMVRDLNFDVRIFVAPTVRESDGLAMSSRNAYLNEQQRKDATVLFHALTNAEKLIKSGEKNTALIIATIRLQIAEMSSISSIDYISVANALTLEEIEEATAETILISLAVRLGTTRLIDNIIIHNQ
jgi:pantoate--beta-alanine ligase